MKQHRPPRFVYLASASPRRRELLGCLGLRFEAVPVRIDESTRPDEAAADLVERLALAKASAALDSLGAAEAPVLAADTVVAVADRLLGKPRDRADAIEMLRLLSGAEHEVFTGVAVVSGARSKLAVSRTRVAFRSVSDAEARRYWNTGEPRDKAGAYAIQGRAAAFVSRIDGSYSGVVGLPLFETAQLLEHFGFRFPPADRDA